MDTTYQEIIKETITKLLEKLDFEATVEIEEELTDPKSFLCKLSVVKDQNFLIGQYGTNLAAIQHIMRVILRKRIEEKINIVVDVNDYFLEKRVLLEKEAQRAADEVLEKNISMTLRPMLPYERKVVHSFLAENPHVTTESIGNGEARKVVVHPSI